MEYAFSLFVLSKVYDSSSLLVYEFEDQGVYCTFIVLLDVACWHLMFHMFLSDSDWLIKYFIFATQSHNFSE
jgi:hypothetical protein